MGDATVTIRDCEEFHGFLRRQRGDFYIIQNDPEATEANRRAAEEVQRGVKRYPRYAYALTRNWRIVEAIMSGAEEQRAEAVKPLDTYEKAATTVRAAPISDADPTPKGAYATEEARAAALQALMEEHDVLRLRKEAADRIKDLYDSPALGDDGVTPVAFYRIPFAQLPGWNDGPEVPDDKRGGLLGIAEFDLLMRLGVVDGEPPK
jgi:hypothetical protein